MSEPTPKGERGGFRAVAVVTLAAARRLVSEMERQGLDEVKIYRLDLDSRWIVALRPEGGNAAMISQAGETPDEEAAAERAEWNLRAKGRK